VPAFDWAHSALHSQWIPCLLLSQKSQTTHHSRQLGSLVLIRPGYRVLDRKIGQISTMIRTPVQARVSHRDEAVQPRPKIP
jgi:hypothetical protein